MGFTAEQLASHPRLHVCIREQSRALLGMHSQNPRMSSVFATQQRWLMAHAGLALYFGRDAETVTEGLLSARFLDLIQQYDVASRNTADAFLKEMLHYNFIRYVAGVASRRMRPMEPTEPTVLAVGGWVMVHLTALDAIDGGNRCAPFMADPQFLGRIQPRIAFALLSSNAVREPDKTFSLFTWLNNGGIVMDSLIAGIAETDAQADHVPTDVQSVADLASRLTLSRTHLTRKLRAAEAMGSIGWMGKRGQSVMWVSRGFRQEYAVAQAVKLAIIDQAFGAVLAEHPLAAVPAASVQVAS